MTNPAAPNGFDPKCMEVLDKAAAKVGVASVAYATEFSRADEQLKSTGMVGLASAGIGALGKAGSKSIASGIPTNGWLVVTDEGLNICGRAFLGKIGASKGVIPHNLVAQAQVGEGDWPGQYLIAIQFADGSVAQLTSKTKAANKALGAWVSNMNQVAVAAQAQAQTQAQTFDANALYAQGGVTQ